jgi:uncharacterized cupredoxin-like copper-binding protein
VAPLSRALTALGSGDAGPFSSDETFEQYSAFIASSVEACEFETASIEAGDYWFEGVPEELSSGSVAVRLTNTSTREMHEFVVFRKTDPEQPAEEILAMDESAMDGAMTFVGVAFASPGEAGTGLISFEEGAYMAVCFVPIGGDDGGPPHFTAGQIAEFTVA